MPIVIIVGGQFGSEGKGKITSHLCRNYNFDMAVRCGGPNSGHTITFDNKQIVLRQIPAGVANPNTKLYLAAGCLIDLSILFNEINMFDLSSDRLKIDNNAAIIDKNYVNDEIESDLRDRIGSTCSGTGFTVANRALRKKNVKLAKDILELKPYITSVSNEINKAYSKGEKIIIEGTQGFGLSLYHSPYYPYATSRDTTASGFISEVGISPLIVSEIIMVIRTFPIRVGGNSGPLYNEIDWEIVQKESGYPNKIQEFTSVTNRLRRVGRFDIDLVKKALLINKATSLALMGLDYLDYQNKSINIFNDLTNKSKEFISILENEFNVPINFIGSGPTDNELIDRLKEGQYEKGRTKNQRFSKILS